MANHVESNYAYIDTFGADVTIASGRAKILAITVYAAAAAEYAVFINSKGRVVAIAGGAQDAVDHFTPCQPVGCDGLVFDDSASTLEANDFVIVHLA